MTPQRMSYLAEVTGGRLRGEDALFNSVSTDTRSLGKGQLFIALQGPRFDGNEYVGKAAQAGAAGALVRQFTDHPIAQVQVGDTRLALGKLARAWRQRFDLPVVAITGSNGKTTVKEMTASILRQRGPVLATQGNLNNEIGVPLTLLRLDSNDRAAVVELGANHPGEIQYLAGIAQPDVAVISNAGPAHLEGFGSVEGVARAKGEIFSALGPAGVAILNADDAYADLWRELIGRRQLLSFGIDKVADFHASAISQDAEADVVSTRFKLNCRAGSADISIPFAGLHNVRNALAAAAGAFAAGASLADIEAGLAAAATIGGRLQLGAAASGARLIDDTYNANPESLKAALLVQKNLGGEAWLVLGDMGELGETAAEQHALAGELARRMGVVRLLATGELAAHAVEGFGEGAVWYPDISELVAALNQDAGPGISLLVKASRSMHFEQVVEALLAGATGAARQANGS